MDEKEALLSGKVKRQVVTGEGRGESYVVQNPRSELTTKDCENSGLIYFSISTGTLFDCHQPLVVFATDI